ncbi:MAG TPA: MoaD/ThiS family protein [Nitrospira sp.]|nr:MoaD/ThiS family protein [Nitrospira sp.]
MVKVLVFGLTLRQAVGAHEIELDVAGPTTIKKMIDAHPQELGALVPFMHQREVLVAVNKKVGSEDSPVKDGDVVKLTHQSKTSYDGVRDIPT